MTFIGIPTEQTTALTDALLGLEALLLAGYLHRFAGSLRARARCWQSLLLFTALASFWGAVAHGIEMSQATYELLWIPLLLFLGLLVGNLALAATYDRFGPQAAKRSWPWLLAAALVFFGLTKVEGVTFLIFILYEAAAMLFALTCYGWLALRGRLSGAGIITVGIILQLVAAAVQASGPFQVIVIWVFDHNGLFHIIGMVATLVMVLGVSLGFPRSAAAQGAKHGQVSF